MAAFRQQGSIRVAFRSGVPPQLMFFMPSTAARGKPGYGAARPGCSDPRANCGAIILPRAGLFDESLLQLPAQSMLQIARYLILDFPAKNSVTIFVTVRHRTILEFLDIAMLSFVNRLSVCVLLLIALANASFAQPLPPGRTSAEAAGKIESDLQKQGWAPIIVELTADAAISQDATSDARLLAEVGRSQDAWLASVFGGSSRTVLADAGVRFVRKMRLSPTVALEATREAIGRISASPAVARIHYNAEGQIQDANVAPGTVPALARPTYGGGDQIVAILDTGVAAGHRSFAAKIVDEECFSTNTSRHSSLCPNRQDRQSGPGAAAPCESSDCAHGTGVAAMAAGAARGVTHSGPNDALVFQHSGAAPFASIFAIQVFSRVGQNIRYQVADVIAAMEEVYLRRNSYGRKKIAAVNLSIGEANSPQRFRCDDDPMRPTILRLKAVDIVTVIASGNDGFKDAVSRPGCVWEAVTVSATNGALPAGFANSSSLVDYFAPGENVLTAHPNGGFVTTSGTSFAAPSVAGMLASLRGRFPALGPDVLLRALSETGRPFNDNNTIRPRAELQPAIEKLDGARIVVHGPTSIQFSRGGPPSTDRFDFFVKASSEPSQWTLTVDEGRDWVEVQPGSGIASPAGTPGVFKVLKPWSGFSVGTHVARATLRNLSAQQEPVQVTFAVTVSESFPQLSIWEEFGNNPVVAFEGPEGGPFVPIPGGLPSHWLGGGGVQPINYTLAMPEWISAGAGSGVLAPPFPGDRRLLTFRPSAEANRLPPGLRAEKVSAFNQSFSQAPVTRDAIIRVVRRDSPGALVVSANEAHFVGPRSGGYDSNGASFQLTSAGSPISWTLSNLPPWLSASAVSGQTPATVTLSPNEKMPLGAKARSIEFRNDSGWQPTVERLVTVLAY